MQFTIDDGTQLFAVILLATIVAVIVTAYRVCGAIRAWFLRLLHPRKDDSRRDRRRTFTATEKKAASLLCGNRCEGGIIFRCDSRGHLHGDHWYPHSRGGATSWDNLVMLCPDCNRRKSDHIPSFTLTQAVRLRRKHHIGYTGDMPTSVGSWM